MAWQHRNTQTGGPFSSVTDFTVTKPTGVASGDLLVAFMASPSATVTWTLPTGWVEAVSQASGGSHRSLMAYKVAGSSEPSSYTFTASSGVNGMIACSAFYEDALSGAPMLVTADWQATASGTSHATPSISPSVSNLLMVACFSLNNGGGGSNSWTPPSTYTERADISLPTNSNSLSVNSKVEAAAGTFSATATSSRTAAGRAFLAAFAIATGHGLLLGQQRNHLVRPA